MKLFHNIHLWLSVPFGLIITLICFSGAMLIFEPEITRNIKSDIYYVSSSKGDPVPMEKLMETVKATLPDSVSIRSVTIFKDKERTYQVNLSKPRRASLFIDQHSGRITGKYERIGFFSTMFSLHRWLLDSSDPHGEDIKIGKLLVGVSTLMFIIALISGVIIWLTRARKYLNHILAISVRYGWRGLWNGLHVAGGMYALILLLAMALTGLTWSFNWYRTAFYAVCGVEYAPRNSAGKTKEAHAEKRNKDQHTNKKNSGENREYGPSEFGCWQQVYSDLKTQNPSAPQITVGHGTASVRLCHNGNIRASNSYDFNRNSGEITPGKKYADSAQADKLRGWIYSIHTGELGGILTRVLWFLGALLGASLPLTGYYIWIRRLYKRKKV